MQLAGVHMGSARRQGNAQELDSGDDTHSTGTVSGWCRRQCHRPATAPGALDRARLKRLVQTWRTIPKSSAQRSVWQCRVSIPNTSRATFVGVEVQGVVEDGISVGETRRYAVGGNYGELCRWRLPCGALQLNEDPAQGLAGTARAGRSGSTPRRLDATTSSHPVLVARGNADAPAAVVRNEVRRVVREPVSGNAYDSAGELSGYAVGGGELAEGKFRLSPPSRISIDSLWQHTACALGVSQEAVPPRVNTGCSVQVLCSRRRQAAGGEGQCRTGALD